jgi:hypothetical protein
MSSRSFRRAMARRNAVRPSTIVHEAGHTVVGYAVGYRIIRVAVGKTSVSANTVNGKVDMPLSGITEWAHPDSAMRGDGKALTSTVADLMRNVAGVAAEYVYGFSTDSYKIAGTDRANIENLFDAMERVITFTEQQKKKAIDSAFEMAIVALRENRAVVDSVSSALKSKGVLCEQDINRLCATVRLPDEVRVVFDNQRQIEEGGQN